MTKLTEDQIFDRCLKMIDHLDTLLARGEITRAQYNDQSLDLGRWATAKRQAVQPANVRSYLRGQDMKRHKRGSASFGRKKKR